MRPTSKKQLKSMYNNKNFVQHMDEKITLLNA